MGNSQETAAISREFKFRHSVNPPALCPIVRWFGLGIGNPRHETEMQELRDRYASLTAGERQVMALVVSGLLNKQVGGELGISVITVKAHRGQVMQKMKADSLADLVKIAGKLRLTAFAVELRRKYHL